MPTKEPYASYQAMTDLSVDRYSSNKSEAAYEKKQKQRNEYFLKIFLKDLRSAGLGEKTIRRHIENAYFFLDEMDFRRGELMEDSVPSSICDYLCDEFIRKGGGSSETAIRSFAASMKKFTRSTEDHALIEKGSSLSLKKDMAAALDEAILAMRKCYDEDYDLYEDTDMGFFF